MAGSLNAGRALWLTGAGLVPDHYVASPGTVLGRAGQVSIDREGDAIRVGVEVIRGQVNQCPGLTDVHVVRRAG